MFRGFVNIWNYFSENVTALRMRDNCWGVTQRNDSIMGKLCNFARKKRAYARYYKDWWEFPGGKIKGFVDCNTF